MNIRSFANSYPTTNIVTKIPTNDTVELDLNHTMREPKYGDTWAFARYKQSDGSYIYGWVIESDSNYMQKQDKIGNSAHYSDYIIDDTGAIVVYAAPHYENKIDELTSADGVFQIDVANMVFTMLRALTAIGHPADIQRMERRLKDISRCLRTRLLPAALTAKATGNATK